MNYTTPGLTAFLTLSGDDQKLGFPGGRTVDPAIGLNQLVTDRRGTNTPFDYGNQQGANATAGFTKTLMNGVDLIVDGGVRDKKQQAGFFGLLPTIPFNYVDSHLQTWSITPRLSVKNVIFGMPSAILTGVDYYDATYHSERPVAKGMIPIHTYDLSQQTLAGYFQQTIGLLPTTDFSYGGRLQRTTLKARDILQNDPNCAIFFQCSVQNFPLDTEEGQYALHIGLEHRFNNVFSVFGRAARAFRTPNVDERLSSGPAFDPFFNSLPVDFKLKTQTSHDIEGGVRIKSGPLEVQSSIYNMDLENELHFNPGTALQRQSRSDPPLRLGDQRVVSCQRYRAVARRHGLYPRGVPRRPVRRQRRSAGVPLYRQRRRQLEYLAELSRRRRHLACLERALHGQRSGQHPAPDPSERNGRSQAERRLRALLLVDLASTIFSMRCTTITPSRACSRRAASRPIRCPAGPTW